MLTRFSVFYHTNQTKILLVITCIALLTNITTMIILFEQLEHETLCDQQNDFNDFIENPHHHHHQHHDSIAQNMDNNNNNNLDIIIPQPKKLEHPPHVQQKKRVQKLTPSPSIINVSAASSIVSLRIAGVDYVTFEYDRSPINAIDWSYYLNVTLLSSNQLDCNYDIYISSIFYSSLRKWIYLRENGWFPLYSCPLYLQTEYRPFNLVPHIYQNECSPFWSSDIIYILSSILNPSMLLIQYGFSQSTLWLSNYVQKIKCVDNRKDELNEFKDNLELNKFDISNIDIDYMRMSRKYIERIDPSNGKIVDCIIIEYIPEYHDNVLKYALNVLKPNNGILVIKLSDKYIPNDFDSIINKNIPKHWIRYNSFTPKFLMKSIPFSQEQYLDKLNMSIWITRTIKPPCL